MKVDISMFGDMAIKDLSPKDANSSGRIIKNLRICGSGLYEYHVSEAPLMGLAIPDSYNGDTFKIFRSPEVLEQNKELYARVPIITGHHVRVNTSNAKQLAVGMVGDTVQSEIGEDGETYLYTTGTIITGDGIEAYEKYGELSVGYDPIVEWQEGTYKGQPYQAVLKGFNEINHLLICKTARGGHQCMIMDSVPAILEHKTAQKDVANMKELFKHINNGGKRMGIFKKIFAKPAEKQMSGDARVISAMLQSVKAGADCVTQVKAVQAMVGDSADETLKGYFEDLTGDEVAKASKEDLAKAIDVVDAYCKKVFGDEAEEPKQNDVKTSGDGYQQPTGDEHPADCTCAECTSKKEESKSNGDSIDYDLLATKVAEKLKGEQKSNGDEKSSSEPEKTAGDELEVSRLSALLAGDEKTSTVTSDDVMKGIWG